MVLAMMQNKKELIFLKIHLDLCKKNETLNQSVQHSIQNQRFIKECDVIETLPYRYETKAEIVVSKNVVLKRLWAIGI